MHSNGKALKKFFSSWSSTISALLAVLKSSSNSKNVGQGKTIHARAIASGSESNLLVASSLVTMYSKCGSTANATRVFDSMPLHDAVSWNALILCYVDNGQEIFALDTLSEMLLENQTRAPPDAVTFAAAIKACAGLASKENIHSELLTKIEALEKTMRVHSRAARMGFEQDMVVASSLVDAYAKCGSLLDSRRVFDRMVHHDVVAWTSLLLGYADTSAPRDLGLTLDLFSAGMEAAGCSPNTRTFVAVIKACANLAVRDNGKKAAMLLKGRDLHLQAEKLGFGRDAFVAASLVNFYAKCGRMEQAREVFDRIKQPDVVSWNALILGYAANGQGEVAYELFQRFLRRHRDGYSSIAPDGVTFAAALNACGGMAAKEQAKLGTGKLLKTLDKVMALHVQAEKSLSCDKFPKSIVNSLMDLYARCGSLEDARRAFDRMSCHSHSNWTSLISIYADYDEPELAFELFEHLQAHDELINARAFLAGLKAVTALVEREQSVRQADGKHLKLVSLKTALEIHYRAISHGCDCDSYVACSLVTLYAKCGSLVEATKVFEEMAEPPDAALWNAVILGCAENEQGDLALEYFARMQATASCKPDAITFCAALEACSVLAGKEAGTQVEGDKVAKLVSLERGMEVHSRIVKDGRGELEQDVVLSSALISMYSKCGSLVDAVRVFERIERHDVVSWTALVLGCVENGEAGLSLRYFWPMLLERDSPSFKPDSIAVVAALKACCALADEERSSLKLDETSSKLMVESLEQGMAVHSEAAKHGFELDMVVANTLVEFYSKCGSMLDARAAFDKMPQRNSSSWTSLLLGYVECGQPEVALELFELARASRRDLFDAPGFVAALKACGVLVSLQSAKDIHAEIYRRPDLLEENELLVTTLVDVYGKCGSMVDAEHIFDYVVAARDDPVIWSALISGYSRQGNTQQVLGVFRKMEGEFVRVSSSSLLCFLTACSHAGLVEKGARCFERMASKYGVSPSLEHYSAMVDLYGRAGKLEAALSLVESVALEANAGIWRSILGACWKWKNSVVARVAYKRLLDMNEADAGAHVTMANLCSLEH